MTTQTTFEATVEGRGDLPDIAVPIKRISNATLRHSALSNVDIEAAGVPDDIRQYATFFAPFELRVAFPNDDRAPERIFKGQLVEVEQSDTSAISTLKTVGRLIKLEKSDGFREFADIRASEALRQYIDEETDFGAAVEDDPGTVVVDDGLAFEASTLAEFNDILGGEVPETAPFDDNGNPLQTGFFVEAEETDRTFSATRSRSDFSDSDGDGTSGAIFTSYRNELRHRFNIGYEIDVSNLSVAVRCEEVERLEDEYTIMALYDGNGNKLTGGIAPPDTLGWVTESIRVQSGKSTYTGDELFELKPIQNVGSTLTYGEVDIDAIFIYDDRYNYNFANSVDSDQLLHGPELYPDGASLEWPILDQETQVSAARIFSGWDDTDAYQELAASPNGGADYLTASNTETLDVDFEGNDIIGADLRIRTTHGRHSPDGPRDQTPRYGYAGRSIDNIEVRFDQISVAIIGPGGILFAENDLQNIKDLASLARYNFVFDHAGDADAIEAFPVGFENPDGVEWMATGWSRRDGDQDYANRVVARGATKPEDERENPDDLRYEAAVRDDAEIERLTDLGLTEEEATQTTVVTDPELSTSGEVRAQAFNELAGVVGARLPSGSIDIVPTFIPPGYAYPVEEFETVDGEVPSKVLEKAAYSEGYGQDAQGSLEFLSPRNWVSGLSPVEKDVIGIKRLF